MGHTGEGEEVEVIWEHLQVKIEAEIEIGKVWVVGQMWWRKWWRRW